MSEDFVKGFLVFMVIVLAVFMGWAVWHHFEDEHEPGGEHFRYRQYPNGAQIDIRVDGHRAGCMCQQCQRLRQNPEDYWRRKYDPYYPRIR
tara:strand:+ start:9303 stop:9575 length:273 start_codon:yes stop_codon:yes gene_type:complete